MHWKFVLIVLLFLSCNQQKEEKSAIKKIISPRNNYISLLYNSTVSKKYMNELHVHLKKAFPFKINLKESPELPVQLKSKIHTDRYRGDSILHYLHRMYVGKAIKTILITHHDISVTKYQHGDRTKIKEPAYRYKDWAVFGYGSCPGYTCVVSVKRLWARNANEKTFLQRLKNISVHELGHTFGLPHCPVQKCVMNDANETIVTIDKSTGLFCKDCRTKLNY